jgi:GH25 family lysozyme M1 (1,4-beta-N-acetylmuramidase)
MKNRNRAKAARRFLSAALVLVMTLSLIAGILPVVDPAYAASEFKYASPYNKTGYSTYYHKAKYSGNLIVNGVDISDWQSKNCRFADAKKAGVDFCIMRVTYSSYSKKTLSMHIDEKFATQYEKAKANGVMTGVYVFSQAKNANEGIKEANYAIKRLKALGIGPEDLNLPVYMDYEFAGGVLGRMHGLKRTQATNAAVGFCNAIKAAGYQPGIYANTTFFGSYITTKQLASDVDLWCAQYNSRNQSAVDYSKWQYSSSARINGMLSYTGVQGRIDANFWYLNKKTAKSDVVTKICGKTTLSVKDAKAPKFKLYAGSKLLKQDTDYTVGGIRNNKTGNGYAFIKGIGDYGGYALIPLKIAKTTEGKASDKISCANYLTKASGERSSYISVAPISYKVGNTYVVQDYLNIRKGAGTKYNRVLRDDLSDTMKKKTADGNKYAVLKPGVKVKCLKVSGNWMKISGGWICCKEGDEIYVK